MSPIPCPRRRSGGWLPALAVLLCLPSQAATAQDEETTFEERARVVLVEVPVRVVRDGSPVLGLEAGDFRVFDRGREVEITSFRVLDFREVPDNPPPRPPLGEARLAPKRNLVFLFDFAYPAGYDRVYGAGHITAAVRGLHGNSESLERLVSSYLGARDRWAVAFFSPLRGVKLLHGWSEDSEEVSQALDVLDAAIVADPKEVRATWAAWRGEEPPGEGLGELQADLRDLLGEARTAGVRGDPFLPHRAMVHELVDGLIEATQALDDVGGPKSVVYVSHGFEKAKLGRLQALFREFRTNNWTIHAISTGGAGSLPSSLFTVAYETGGQAFYQSSYLSEVFEQMFEQTSVSYLLAFRSDELEPDGAYHRLKVELAEEVAGELDGARVIHRRGYYAPRGPERWLQTSTPP